VKQSKRLTFNSQFQIGNTTISEQEKTFIIAEAGVNHNGNMSLAKEMIDVASESGADAVKFQTFKAEKLILKNIEKAPYQKVTTNSNETQYDMLKRLEVTKEQTKELMEYCRKKNIIFLSTPFEKASLDELDELGVSAFKIAATDLTNIQFLRQVAEKGRPIILSAGMCYLEEVERALNAIYPINKNLVLLQCTANYPIQDAEANINVIKTFQNTFDVLVGYSDHSQGVGASPYAVAVGAKVIEKHFTLNKNMEGPDHKASVTPDELRQLVSDIRRVEKYLGDGIKMPSCSEQKTRKSLQKCLVAAKVIKTGEQFNSENIVAKRTDGVGISALYFDKVFGQTATREYRVDDIISFD
jgi:N-acetylneuraminate synthase